MSLIQVPCPHCDASYLSCPNCGYVVESKNEFILTHDEISTLMRYFYAPYGAGFISHEFFPDLHKLIDRICDYAKEIGDEFNTKKV